jgi:hypothetical protein
LFCLFVLLLWVFYFYFYSYFLSKLSTLPSPSSYPYSHPLHCPSSCAKIHCSLAQLLFLPLLIHSLLCPHLPFPFSLNLSPDYLSLLHTPHLLTNLLHQLYITTTPCNPWHKHPTLQQQKYTQTHTKTTKTSSPCTTSLTHPPHFPPPF